MMATQRLLLIILTKWFSRYNLASIIFLCDRIDIDNISIMYVTEWLDMIFLQARFDVLELLLITGQLCVEMSAPG